jgi:hypothetical protein
LEKGQKKIKNKKMGGVWDFVPASPIQFLSLVYAHFFDTLMLRFSVWGLGLAPIIKLDMLFSFF